MSFPRYPEYKDSGVEWLGEVPWHWEVRKLSQLFRAGKGKNGQLLTKEFCGSNEGEYPVYSGQTENDGVMGTWSQFEFDFGDAGVLFATTVGAKAMHLRQLFGRFSLSQNCMIIWATSERCTTRFFFYHLQPLFQFQRALIPEHMQASFRIEDLYSYSVGLPPLPEQTQIAAFLDRETAKIDALVAEQRRLMELLKEKRQAVISHAVTRGLNPHAPLKPSGIEWLGDVPEHWEVRPLKRLARLQTGMTPPTDNLNNYTDEEAFQWIRPEDLDESGIPTRATKFLTLCGWSLTRHIAAGASLICCIGTIGKVGIINADASTNQQITSAQPDQDSRYLFYAIRAGRSQLELASTGNVLRILNTERLGNIRFPAPPLAEQAKIAAYLDSESAKFDTLTTEAQRAIDLLQERRTALISAAVTGQIDVRKIT